MKRSSKWATLAVATVAAFACLESVAWADRVSGVITRTYVIVEDTDLIGDVTCNVGSNPCFSFGAPGVELRLNGFTMTGIADPVTGCAGAILANEYGVTTNEQNRVAVRGPGVIQRFRNHGVRVIGSTDARIETVTASTNCGSGIRVMGTAFGTIVQGNTLLRNGATGPGATCGGI